MGVSLAVLILECCLGMFRWIINSEVLIFGWCVHFESFVLGRSLWRVAVGMVNFRIIKVC